MNSKRRLHQLIRKTGFDLHRFKPGPDRLTWLGNLNIQTIFDIGANVGQFAEEIRLILPRAFIYSFEPLKECYEQLTQTLKNDKNFQAFNHALGEKEVVMIMNKSSYTLSSSLLPMTDLHKTLFPHTKGSAPEEIRIKRLDDMFTELNPKPEILIKVDTQGYEDKVIIGGMKAFSHARVVIMETSFVPLYEGQPLFDDIYQKMKLLGFTYNGAWHQKINQQTGEVIFEDSIFVRSE